MSTCDVDGLIKTTQADCSGFRDAQAQDKLKKFWGNDLILSKIASYVSIKDLKQLSCVNKFLLERVRNVYRFSSLFGQKVTGRMKIHVFKLSRAIVEVDKLNRDTLLRLAPKIFQDTQHLELLGLENYLSDTERNSHLIQIVSNCPQLKSLKIKTLNILKDDNESFLRDENVKTRLVNLKELHIGPTLINYDVQFEQTVEKGDELPTYELFEEITKKMKLVKFTCTEPSVFRNSLNPEFLLNHNSETLKELNLAIDIKDEESLKTMRFPKLCKLRLGVIRWDDCYIFMRKLNLPESLIAFLQIHIPNLIEFHLGANHCYDLAPLCELLAHPKKTKKLKVFGLNSIKPLLPTLDPTFLCTMSSLIDFKLNYACKDDSQDNRDKFSNLLSALPSDIESIHFKGLKFRGFPPKDVQKSISSVLFSFKYLTGLKTKQQFLNFKVINCICKHLSQSQILKWNFYKDTAFGISGFDHKGVLDNTWISLANLRDIAELEIITL